MTTRSTVMPLLRSADIIVRELQGELLIYDTVTKNAFCLSPAARLVADRCDGVSTVRDVAVALAGGGDVTAAETVVVEVLNRFAKDGLLDAGYDCLPEESLPSRRQVLSAAASIGTALPLVSLMVVPTPAEAQSACIGSDQPCLGPGSVCCPGLICVNVEAGPTGHICTGCVTQGNPCTIGGAPCCSGNFCAEVEPGFFACAPIPG